MSLKPITFHLVFPLLRSQRGIHRTFVHTVTRILAIKAQGPMAQGRTEQGPTKRQFHATSHQRHKPHRGNARAVSSPSANHYSAPSSGRRHLEHTSTCGHTHGQRDLDRETNIQQIKTLIRSPADQSMMQKSCVKHLIAQRPKKSCKQYSYYFMSPNRVIAGTDHWISLLISWSVYALGKGTHIAGIKT